MTFTPITEIGEFGLIDRLRHVLGRPADDALVVGIGDDGALYHAGAGSVQVITTDLLVEGVHFDRTFTSMRFIGWKSIAVNVSDIAAMNARPRWATVALGLPNNVSVEQVEALYQGIGEACAEMGVTVVGGDTVAASRLTVSVTVVGEAAQDATVTRAGARPGDLLCVTGDLGSAAAGLRVLLSGVAKAEGNEGDGAPTLAVDLSEFAYVVERQLMPRPRLDRIAHWEERGVRPHALIDVSDGLASDLNHICRASGVGAVIEAGLLPLHMQTVRAGERFGDAPEALALYGGEDYELLFALPQSLAESLDADTFAVVGTVVDADEGVTLRGPEGDLMPMDAGGYDHFRTGKRG